MREYDKWEVAQEISPSSPEAYYAELAWNAALRAAKAKLGAEQVDKIDSLITDLQEPRT